MYYFNELIQILAHSENLEEDLTALDEKYIASNNVNLSEAYKLCPELFDEIYSKIDKKEFVKYSFENFKLGVKQGLKLYCRDNNSICYNNDKLLYDKDDNIICNKTETLLSENEEDNNILSDIERIEYVESLIAKLKDDIAKTHLSIAEIIIAEFKEDIFGFLTENNSNEYLIEIATKHYSKIYEIFISCVSSIDFSNVYSKELSGVLYKYFYDILLKYITDAQDILSDIDCEHIADFIWNIMYHSENNIFNDIELNTFCANINNTIDKHNRIDFVWEALRRNKIYQKNCDIYTKKEFNRNAKYLILNISFLNHDTCICDIRENINTIDGLFLGHPLSIFSFEKYSSLPVTVHLNPFSQSNNDNFMKLQTLLKYFQGDSDVDIHDDIDEAAKTRINISFDPYAKRETIKAIINYLIDQVHETNNINASEKNLIPIAQLETYISYLEKYDELVEYIIDDNTLQKVKVVKGTYELPKKFFKHKILFESFVHWKYLKMYKALNISNEEFDECEDLTAFELVIKYKNITATDILSAYIPKEQKNPRPSQKPKTSEKPRVYTNPELFKNLLNSEKKAYKTAYEEATKLIRAAPDIEFSPESKKSSEHKDNKKMKQKM